MLRRHLLAALGASPAVFTLNSAHSDDGNDTDASAPLEPDPSTPRPLEACFGTADFRFHDETVDVRVTTGETWTGREYRPVADLRFGLGDGEVTVTLYEEDIRALLVELGPAVPDP